MKEPNIRLTQEQIDFYHREGYLTLEAITSPDEVASLQAIYDHLFASKAGRESGDHLDLSTPDTGEEEEALPQILNPSKYAPELIDTYFRANAQAIAEQLLGPEARFGGDHAIRKPPGTGVETPWHQDEAYWDPGKEYNSLSIWIPLQEATIENGCMVFVPKSHVQEEILPHHSIGHDPRIIGLEVDNAEEWAAKGVACPIPAGGATIHHCRTLHYTGPNRSNGPRRAYILGFGVPPKQREVERDFYWQRMQQTQWQERVKAAQAGKKSGM